MADIFALHAKVKLNSELIRIKDLPRRVWEVQESEKLAVELTRSLKTPGGKMQLRPLQAVALAELKAGGVGLFAPIRVGGGKTLLSLLAPTVTKKERPLLLVPAKLIKKTEREMSVLKFHFRVPEFYRIMSYEWISRQEPDVLFRYSPDIIVADEGHKLKNTKAAVTKKVLRYVRQREEVPLVIMSGTITRRSLKDYWHLIRRSLGDEMCPLPTNWNDLDLWSAALDQKKEIWETADPSAFEVFGGDPQLWQTDKKRAARLAFRQRLVESPCVVASKQGEIDASIQITAVEPKLSPEVDEAFQHLRDRWETPDGWAISDGLGMFRHARELALGFYYKWDPRPPEYWIQARAKWSAFVRQVLKHSRKLDSELQVRREHLDTKEWKAWEKVRKDFDPNTVAVWIDFSLVDYCVKWAKKNRGIVWVEHTEFGVELRKRGLQYYGSGGLNRLGQMIEDHPKGRGLAASISSNSEGRNLQKWSTNLVVSPPPGGSQWEQLLGRTHRDGQEEDEVSVDMILTCVEHAAALERAVEDSRYVEDTTGAEQKLLLADITVPSPTDIAARKGPRWSSKR